jgi:hypothetical protein
MKPEVLMRAWWLLCAMALLCVGLRSESAYGQAGLRESLERLDRNQNGMIEPGEITSLARPYLERITKERRIDLDRPIEIHKLQEAARIYYALANGVASQRVRAEGGGTVVPFGPQEDDPLVPAFGLAKVRYPYTLEDLEEADQTLRRYDDNDNGFIDGDEIDEVRWTHRNPFADDLDNDGRFSRLELGQRYARRRLLKDDAGELVELVARSASRPAKERPKISRNGGNRVATNTGSPPLC